MATRNVVLTDAQSSLVDRLVETGRYQNASEALRAGLRLLEREESELNALRRHATLAATGIRLEESLTDATLTMFDKLLGSMARRAENRTRDKAVKTVRELQGHLRTLTGSCRLLIDARSKGVDSLAQIEALDWQRFAVAVEQAEVLGRPETVDRTSELIERHRTVKLFAGAFLNTFEFRGAGAVQGLLSALTIIAELYRTGKRRLPDRVPLRFVPSAWRPFVLRDGIVDRAAYELCVLAQLRERLRAGDISVRPKTPIWIVTRSSATMRLATYGDFRADDVRGFLLGHIRPFGQDMIAPMAFQAYTARSSAGIPRMLMARLRL